MFVRERGASRTDSWTSTTRNRDRLRASQPPGQTGARSRLIFLPVHAKSAPVLDIFRYEHMMGEWPAQQRRPTLSTLSLKVAGVHFSTR